MKVFRTGSLAAALAGGMALPAAAQVNIEALGLTLTATPAAQSDYLFRGISQTRNRPALQLTLDLEHSSGFYIGAFASNVAFLGTDARQEIDALAGYRFELATVKFDIGGIYYTYPGYQAQPGQFELSYWEVALKASRAFGPVKLLGGFNFSPNYFSRSGHSYYLEAGADVTLPWEFQLSGRLGYTWIERNSRFGTPDYLWYGIWLQRSFYNFTVFGGWYGTNVSQRECAPVAGRADDGQKVCDGRFMFGVSYTF